MSKKNESPPAALTPVAVIPVAPAVADAIARASVGVIPTPRGTHPGTIAFVTMFTLTAEVIPISEFPDSFIYVDGVPVVRNEFFGYDENGQPCPNDKAVTSHIIRYGADGASLQRVYGTTPQAQAAAAQSAAALHDEHERWLKKAMENRAEQKKHKP